MPSEARLTIRFGNAMPSLEARQTIQIVPARSFVWLLSLFFYLSMASCFSSAQDKARLNEVKRIWLTFPLYSGMQEVNNSTASGFGKAYISKGFRSQANYDDVKRFYLERLNQDGWQLAGERQVKDWERDLGGRELKFRRVDYEATIEYAGERAKYAWDYCIGIGWRHY